MTSDEKAPAVELVFERIAPPNSRFIAWAAWVACAGAFIASGLALQGRYPGLKDGYVWTVTTLAVGFVAVPLAFWAARKLFLDWVECFPNFVVNDAPAQAKKFIDEMQFFRGNASMFGCGMFIALVAVTSYWTGGFFTDVPLVPRTYLYTVLAVSAFVAGMGLCAIFLGTRALFQVTDRFEIRVANDKFGVVSTGIAMIRIFLCIALAWSFYVLSAFTRDGDIVLGTNIFTPPMYALAFPTLAFFIVAFFVSLFPLHRKMVRFKRQRMLEVTDLLTAIRPVDEGALTSEIVEKVEFLEKQRDGIQQLPEWPFLRKTLLGVALTSATSIWPILVNATVAVWVDQVMAMVAE